MKTLQEAVQAKAGIQSKAILRYLGECDLNDWQDLTKANLYDFRDHVAERVAQSSARTYFAVLKAIMARYEEEVEFCKDYKDILKAKNEKPIKTFLTMKELAQLEKAVVRSEVEQYVLDEFLIGAYTGMRISDAREVSEENMANGYLSYVSIKTSIQAVVPLKEGIAERIRRVQANDCKVSLAGYNKALRRLCQRADIVERVKVFKAGDHLKGYKWEYVSSHTARISFATNLANLGVPIIDISRMLGHSSVLTTQRYIVDTKPGLDAKAMRYFQ